MNTSHIHALARRNKIRMFNSIDWLRFLELSYYLGMGSPFSTGFKSTTDPLLNWQEHVRTPLQVSFDVERATSIRITLTEIENLALAISPGSSSNLVTKGPLLVPSPYLHESCRELWEGTAFNPVDLLSLHNLQRSILYWFYTTLRWNF